MEAQEYIDEMARDRGFVPDFHKIMARHDFDVLLATDDLTRATMLSERKIEMPTKELLIILALVMVGGDSNDVAVHMRAGLRSGVTPEEILEALELVIPLAGVVRFKEGFEVWREVTEAQGLEPRIT